MNKLNRHRGVSLIELLVVVAIVGILAAVAYPSYRRTVMKSNRTDGRSEILNIAGSLEKCFTRNMRYNDTSNCTIASQLNGGSYTTITPYYTVTGSAGSWAFTVTASARLAQLNDTDCLTLTVNEVGTKTAMKTGSVPNNVACWK